MQVIARQRDDTTGTIKTIVHIGNRFFVNWRYENGETSRSKPIEDLTTAQEMMCYESEKQYNQ